MRLFYIIIIFLVFIALITLLLIAAPKEKSNIENPPIRAEILESKCSENLIEYIKIKVNLLRDIDFGKLDIKVTTKKSKRSYEAILIVSKKGESQIITLNNIPDVKTKVHKYIVELYGKNYYEELEGYCGAD